VPKPPAPKPARPEQRFTRAQRLTHDREYQAAYADKLIRTRGPLVIYARANAKSPPRARLGLSVGRRVGSAVARNRVKRLLREAFRLRQHDLPPGIDLVVNVRPHKPLTVEAYGQHLVDAALSLARAIRRGPEGSSPEPA
jgi:ribonuclease P protein component